MNTYRLEPKENERYLSFLYSFRFYPSKIKEIIKRETEKVMEKEKEFLIKYSDDAAKRIAAEVSEQVRNAIKPTGEDAVIPRHKLIVQSVVGERGGQGRYNIIIMVCQNLIIKHSMILVLRLSLH